MDERLQQMFEIKGAEMSMPSTMSPEIRSKVTRNRIAYGSAAAVAVAAAIVALFVWAGANDDATPEFAPAEEGQVEALAGKQLDAGTMETGVYAIDEFEFAPFAIEVAEGFEWEPKIWGPGMFEMSYVGANSGYLTFFQEWEEVIDPKHALQGGVPAPQDLRAWLLDHPALDVSNVTSLKIDGYPATLFDATYNGMRPSACGKGCWQFAPASEFWGGTMLMFEADGPQRIAVIETPNGEVIAQMGGSEGFLQDIAPETLQTVDFAD